MHYFPGTMKIIYAGRKLFIRVALAGFKPGLLRSHQGDKLLMVLQDGNHNVSNQVSEKDHGQYVEREYELILERSQMLLFAHLVDALTIAHRTSEFVSS